MPAEDRFILDRRGVSILEFNARPLEDKTLHVCFRKTPEGEAARARLDAAFGAMDVRVVFEKALGSSAARASPAGGQFHRRLSRYRVSVAYPGVPWCRLRLMVSGVRDVRCECPP